MYYILILIYFFFDMKVLLLFWFDLFLEARAEIHQIFLLVVLKIDVVINSFWLYLTFTEMWEDTVHLGIPLKVIPTKESPLKQSRLFNAYHIYSRQVCQLQSNWPFQYGPVIKLPLHISHCIIESGNLLYCTTRR